MLSSIFSFSAGPCQGTFYFDTCRALKSLQGINYEAPTPSTRQLALGGTACLSQLRLRRVPSDPSSPVPIPVSCDLIFCPQVVQYIFFNILHHANPCTTHLFPPFLLATQQLFLHRHTSSTQDSAMTHASYPALVFIDPDVFILRYCSDASFHIFQRCPPESAG